MSIWPFAMTTSRGTLSLPEPGRYCLMPGASEQVIDELLDSSRQSLGAVGVGWLPESGGLLSNLPAWENLLLATQWHAPASLPALESRVRAWLAQLGYDDAGSALLMSLLPSRLTIDECRLVGWLRQLLARPKLVLLAGMALPEGALGQRVLALIEQELSGSVLLVIDGEAPAWFTSVSFRNSEAIPP